MPNTRAHGPASTPKRSSMARRIARAVQAVSPLPDFGLASAFGVSEDGAAEGGAGEAGETDQHVAPGTPQAGPHEDLRRECRFDQRRQAVRREIGRRVGVSASVSLSRSTTWISVILLITLLVPLISAILLLPRVACQRARA